MSPTSLSTELFEDATPRLVFEGAALKITSGPDKGTVFLLDGESIRIGTGADCELVLHDGAVSGCHAQIVASVKGYSLRDCGSKNGLFVGNIPIERVPLTDGMKIRLGVTTIVVSATGKQKIVALDRPGMFGHMIAHSIKMRAVVASLKQLAAADVSVLIEGETGTGKEVAAQALHDHSQRRREPFVILDCAAVGPTLMNATLFGHDKGAFTGANEARAGLLEQAEGGTLFLDEIGELPLQLQPLLLGALERRVSRRLGGSRDISHDVRIIAATNRNLLEEARQGRFREDLYYRIAVARVRMPPLRERKEDVGPLAKTFAAALGVTLPPDLIALLSSFEWPGNVRELRNAILRFSVQPNAELSREKAHANPIDAFDAHGNVIPINLARAAAHDEFERRYLEQLIQHTDGNLSRAAELAKVSRQFFTRLCTKYSLRAKDR